MTISSRRQAFEKVVSSVCVGLPTFFLTTSTTISVEPANAFANKISTKYDDRPKRKGPQVSYQKKNWIFYFFLR